MGSGSSAGCSPAKRHRWEEVENPVSSDFDLKARQATKGCLWLVGSVTTSFALQGASEGKIEAIEKLTARRLTGVSCCAPHQRVVRSEERRVGKRGVSTCRSRWWSDH